MSLANNAANPFTLNEADLIIVQDDSANPVRKRALPLHKILTTQHPSTIGWVDLERPAGVGIPGAADVAANGNLLFSSVATENAFFSYQLNHDIMVGSGVRFHVHWAKSTDAANDVVWQIKWRLLVLDAVPTAWTDWLDVTSRAGTLSSDQRQIIDAWDEWDMSVAGLSSLIEVEIQRDHDHDDDTYGADAVLMQADLHVQIDSIGSQQEYVK